MNSTKITLFCGVCLLSLGFGTVLGACSDPAPTDASSASGSGASNATGGSSSTGGFGGSGGTMGTGGQGGGASVCGNGAVEAGEQCDGNCPDSCPDDGNACTLEALSGSAAQCDALCTSTAIMACTPGDGCCPMGCDASMDFDCVVCDVNVPADKPTIGEAILAAPQPGIVCIAPGTYTGDLVMRPHVSLQGKGPQTLIKGHILAGSLEDPDPTPTFIRDLTLSADNVVVSVCPPNAPNCFPSSIYLNGGTIALDLERVIVDGNATGAILECANLEVAGGNLLFSFRDSTCISQRGIRFRGDFDAQNPRRFELDVTRSRFEGDQMNGWIYDSIEFLITSGNSCGQQVVPKNSAVEANIVNNEFFSTHYESIYLTPCLAMDPADAANSRMWVVNNTFVPKAGVTGDLAYGVWYNALPGFEPAFTFANNLYVGTSANAIRGAQPDLSAGNITTDQSPFKDIAMGNLELMAGSPPIDAADPMYAPAEDRKKNPRPTDGDANGSKEPDVGAYEYIP